MIGLALKIFKKNTYNTYNIFNILYIKLRPPINIYKIGFLFFFVKTTINVCCEEINIYI